MIIIIVTYSSFCLLAGLFKPSRVNVSCTAVLNQGNETYEWWSLIHDGNYVVQPNVTGQLEMIIYSERVAKQLFSAISGIG